MLLCCERCASRTSASSATASSPRSSSASGEVVWCCLPRFDSEPVFSTLLDDEDGGRFAVGPADGEPGDAALPRRTPTSSRRRFETPTGAFRVLDFAPRFVQYDRIFRPDPARPHRRAARRARRASACAASRGSAGRRRRPRRVQGSHHLALRGLREPAAAHHRHPALLPRRPAVRADRAPAPGAHLGRARRGAAARRCATASWTRRSRYWQRWVKHCDIPPLYQQRGHPLGAGAQAALLRGHRRHRRGDDDLDSGGARQRAHLGLPLLLAARRLLRARRLPAARATSRSASSFVDYLLNVAGGAPGPRLAPLYRVDGTLGPRGARSSTHWPGFDGEGPVRVGNGAALHTAARHLRRDGAGAGADLPRRALQRGALAGRRST